MIPPRPGLTWTALLVFSLPLAFGLNALGLPAAFLLGPLVAAVAVAAGRTEIRVPQPLFLAAQGVVGCMVARAMTAAIPAELARRWPAVLFAVLAVLLASTLLGMLLMRLRVLPGTTAIWGASPGAAMAMVLMAERYGADMRLVALMQYLRVVVVAAVASCVTRLFATDHAPPPHPAWFAPVPAVPFAQTAALVLAGMVLGQRLRIPAGGFLAPMVLGALAQDAFGLRLTLPTPLLLASYAILGWSIGLRFTRPVLWEAVHALPRVLLSIGALVAMCGAFAWVLVRFAGVAPLTAYLATSPGGADSVAVIAATSPVDVSFVMSLQVARFVVVLLAGPALARWAARAMRGADGAAPP